MVNFKAKRAQYLYSESAKDTPDRILVRSFARIVLGWTCLKSTVFYRVGLQTQIKILLRWRSEGP